MEKISLTASATDAGLRLDSFLAEKAGSLSRSRAKSLIKEGAVMINGVPTDDPRKAVVEGSTYTLVLPEPIPAVPQPEDIPLEILFEDEHLIIINKASGMAVHPAPGSWDGTLVNALLFHCEGQLPGIGRQDRSGPFRPLGPVRDTRHRALIPCRYPRRAPALVRHNRRTDCPRHR